MSLVTGSQLRALCSSCVLLSHGSVCNGILTSLTRMVIAGTYGWFDLSGHEPGV